MSERRRRTRPPVRLRQRGQQSPSSSPAARSLGGTCTGPVGSAAGPPPPFACGGVLRGLGARRCSGGSGRAAPAGPSRPPSARSARPPAHRFAPRTGRSAIRGPSTASRSRDRAAWPVLQHLENPHSASFFDNRAGNRAKRGRKSGAGGLEPDPGRVERRADPPATSPTTERPADRNARDSDPALGVAGRVSPQSRNVRALPGGSCCPPTLPSRVPLLHRRN